jgi:protein-S-isoprenylcysteine O-methyltransferase Ste14
MGLITVCLLLFLPAGSIYYWNAWIFIGVLFVPMFAAGIILLMKSPDLLAKRLNTKEKEIEQKQVILLSLFMFVGGFIVAALDFRYSWSKLLDWIIIMAVVIFLISYALYAEVMRENAYLSRTVEVQVSQKVICTGLYGIVRHPMYLATITLFMSIPLILGSVYAFIIFLIYPLLITKRIKNEEAVLKEGLDGYIEYTEKIKYRLIPYIW